jgi:hypothetical protein
MRLICSPGVVMNTRNWFNGLPFFASEFFRNYVTHLFLQIFVKFITQFLESGSRNHCLQFIRSGTKRWHSKKVFTIGTFYFEMYIAIFIIVLSQVLRFVLCKLISPTRKIRIKTIPHFDSVLLHFARVRPGASNLS